MDICLAEAAAPSDSLVFGRRVQIYLLTYSRSRVGHIRRMYKSYGRSRVAFVTMTF